MGKKNKKSKVMLTVACMIISYVLSGCGKTDTEGMLVKFHQSVTEKVLEYSEIGEMISASDIAIDKVYYGAFSQKNVNEIFVLCKILNQPHVGGFDRTMGLLLQADTLDLVTYKEFLADKVVINCIQNSNGQSRVLFVGTTTYQNISTQEISLFKIEENEWTGEPIPELEAIENDFYCFAADDKIFVTSTEYAMNSEDVICVLQWYPDTEQFK